MIEGQIKMNKLKEVFMQGLKRQSSTGRCPDDSTMSLIYLALRQSYSLANILLCFNVNTETGGEISGIRQKIFLTLYAYEILWQCVICRC